MGVAGAVVVVDPASPVVAAHLARVLAYLGLAVVLLAAGLLAARRPTSALTAGAEPAEPLQQRILRVGSAALWFALGISAARPSGVLGVGASSLPAALTGSPRPFSTLGQWCAQRWLAHPTWASAAVVAVGLGLGLWLLVASPGRPSRLAGLAAAALATSWWMASGLAGLFGHGGWASGAGGASPWLALAAGALALGSTWWEQERNARRARRLLAVVLLGLGLAQLIGFRLAWSAGAANPVATHAAELANASSWTWLAELLRSSANAVAAHAVLGNLVVSLLLLAVGLALGWTSRRWRILAAATYVVAALAAWVLLGAMGVGASGSLGLGALPSSGLLVVAVAMGPGPGFEPWGWPATLRRALSALGVSSVLLGSALSLAVAVWPGADADLALAGGLSAAPLNGRQPPALMVQHLDGSPFTFDELRGRVGVVVFMDPICNTDCRALAREVDVAVARAGGEVVPIAVNLNPEHPTAAAMRRFARREQLSTPPWVLLTGSAEHIRVSAKRWQVSWAPSRGGGMLLHDDPVYIVGAKGRITTAWEAPPDESGGVQARSTITAISKAIQQARGR